MGQKQGCCDQPVKASDHDPIEQIIENNSRIRRQAHCNDEHHISEKGKLIRLKRIPMADAQSAQQQMSLSESCSPSRDINAPFYEDTSQLGISTNIQTSNAQIRPLDSMDTQADHSLNNSENCNPKAQQQQQSYSFPVDQKYTVRETYLDKTFYEGEKYNHQRQGKGQLTFPNGAVYKGTWEQDTMDGRGILYYPSGQLAYQGQFTNNTFDGYGILMNEDVDYLLRDSDEEYYKDFDNLDRRWVKYEGEFRNDKKHGRGKIFFPNGDIITAKFVNGKFHGQGTIFTSNYTNLICEWSENKLVQKIN